MSKGLYERAYEAKYGSESFTENPIAKQKDLEDKYSDLIDEVRKMEAIESQKPYCKKINGSFLSGPQTTIVMNKPTVEPTKSYKITVSDELCEWASRSSTGDGFAALYDLGLLTGKQRFILAANGSGVKCQVVAEFGTGNVSFVISGPESLIDQAFPAESPKVDDPVSSAAALLAGLEIPENARDEYRLAVLALRHQLNKAGVEY